VPALADAPLLDFFDPAVEADPEPFYADLRSRTAVARTPLGATVIRRAEVHDLLTDPRLVTSLPFLVRMQGVAEGWVFDMITSSVIATEGTDHTRLRRLVSRSFTPGAAARHRPMMQALVHDLVDAFAPTGRCEFVAEFADQ
jgi:cytochrome P450